MSSFTLQWVDQLSQLSSVKLNWLDDAPLLMEAYGFG